MKPRPAPLALALLLALGAVSAAANPPGYYRWQDERGQFQATQRPPMGRPAEFIRLSTGAGAPAADTEAVSPAGDGPVPPAPAPRAIQAMPDPDPDKCAAARRSRDTLAGHARIRERGADGAFRYLAPEEVNEQKRLAEEAIAVFCEE